MITQIRELIERRELLLMFAYREIQVKYKQSVMGFAWALFMPMIIVLAGLIVRYGYAIVAQTPFDFAAISSVSVKAVPWAFVVSSIKFASMSLIGNRNLVTKIYFPRTIIPVSATLSQGVDFAVASVVLLVVLTLAQIGISIHILLVPVLIAILVLMVIGVGVITSAASLFFRDVKYLVDAFLSFAIFFTPVFYEVELFGRYAPVLMLNPVAPILEGLRTCIVVHAMPPMGWVAYSAVFALAVFVAAFALFKKLEPAFAESI